MWKLKVHITPKKLGVRIKMTNFKDEVENLIMEKGEERTLKEALQDIYSKMKVPDLRTKGAINNLLKIGEIITESHEEITCFFEIKKNFSLDFVVIDCEGVCLIRESYSIQEAFNLNLQEEANFLVKRVFTV